ncbi:hypothetical protein T492DRAFT_940859 [Pavlovales sp. CCMP2436]|nr:hypothetical protein T492DRAFT_940859 [Pavlovales sp. CCMP2436]|mmetsp:Transcript_2230/g.5739  ORF Transcript_2230/g.5739 Transcript_2230/m.5739 type:complete len:287 (+) Transcript_2230:66-926(+)
MAAPSTPRVTAAAQSTPSGREPVAAAPSRRRAIAGAVAALLVALACRKLASSQEAVPEAGAKPPALPKRAPLDHLFTHEELAAHGPHGPKYYLSILGTVFDVSAGEVFYSEGASYPYFVGCDASRAFQSGEAADATDDLSTFTEDAHFAALVNWKKFYVEHQIYTQEGKLVGGNFYTLEGNPTSSLEAALEAAERYQRVQDAAEAKTRLANAPHCGTRVEHGARSVWCSSSHHVPRELVVKGQAGHCICVPLTDAAVSPLLLSVFPGCEPDANRCTSPFDPFKRHA